MMSSCIMLAPIFSLLMVRGLTSRVIPERKGRTTQAYNNASRTVPEGSVEGIIQRSMCNYLWTGCKTFQGIPQISITFDLSVRGKEDTLAIGLYSKAQSKAMRLPTQVRVEFSCSLTDILSG